MEASEVQASRKKTVKFCWAFVADMALFVIIVEAINILEDPFKGYFPSVSIELVRIIFYAIALLQIVVIKWAANIPLKKPTEGEWDPLRQLRLSSFVIFGICETIALLGFVLYLMEGLRLDFYIFTAMALFYLGIYFPRQKEWENWAQKT